jgi:GDP-4-dehydro-6-deoxy-D-mannose reductase
MRFLVTGAAAFIGSRLCPTLRSRGIEVVEYDGDVRNQIRAVGRFDAVVHLAGRTRGETFARDPASAYETNVIGTANVLRFCSRVEARCVFVSSSAVYGLKDAAGQISESEDPNPQAPYAMSKWLAEGLCRRWAAEDDGEVAVMRLFNVYGAGQDPSFIVPYVIESIRNDRPVKIETPRAVRDFVHIDDIVDALFLAAVQKHVGVGVYNIGTGRGTHIAELAELVGEVFSKQARIEETGDPDANPDWVVSDNSSAREELRWSPRFDLRSGLEQVRDELTAGGKSQGDHR